jgi:hypothetical protein
LITATRRRLLSGVAAGGLALAATSFAARASTVVLRPFRGLYRPAGFPRLANDPGTEFLADAWHLDGSALNVNQGGSGAPLWGFSLRGYPYRTQFAAFGRQITAAGQGCGFDGVSQYIYTTIGAGRGPWSASPGSQTFLVVAQVDGQQPAPQTLMGIEAYSLGRRASLQIAANSSTFAVNWVTNTTTVGSFSQSVTIGEPFAAAMTLSYASGLASLFYRTVKSTISGPAKAPNQWDEANFGNSVIGGVNQSNCLNGAVLFGAAWNAVLPDDTIFDLLRDPFGFLIFPDDDLAAQLVGAVASAKLSGGAHGFPR